VIVKIPSVALGVNRDATPEELPLGMWSDCSNVVFHGGYLERAAGMAQIFSAPTITPYYVAPFRTASSLLWLHAGLQKVYVDDGSTRTEVGRAAAYTGTPNDRWTGGVFNGLYLLNNGVDVPQYWNGNVATDFAALPSWPAGYLCKSLRPWKNYAFALAVTQAGTLYPYRVLWSAQTDPGAYPVSFDITDPTKDAGQFDLAETPDLLVDSLPLGDGLVIYKTGSMYLARYTGDPKYVFNFSRLPGDVGMIARNCAVNTPMGHVVLTLGDVILHAGGGPKSIADGRVRRAIFEQMDTTYAERACFVASNPTANEVWVCYPEDGNATCTKAAIWNWKDDAWSFRSLRNVTAGGTGQTPNAVGYTWATVPGTWADTTLTWGGKSATQNDQHLVLAHMAPALSLVGSGIQDVGVSTTAWAERMGIALDDPQTVKMVSTLWPRLEGDAGTVVGIQVGASMKPDVAPTWKPVVNYTIGTSDKIDCFAQGKFLAIRILSITDAPWRLRGIDMDVEPMGRW